MAPATRTLTGNGVVARRAMGRATQRAFPAAVVARYAVVEDRRRAVEWHFHALSLSDAHAQYKHSCIHVHWPSTVDSNKPTLVPNPLLLGGQVTCGRCDGSGRLLTLTEVTFIWEVQPSEHVFDETAFGLPKDVVKNGAGAPLVEEQADRVRALTCHPAHVYHVTPIPHPQSTTLLPCILSTICFCGRWRLSTTTTPTRWSTPCRSEWWSTTARNGPRAASSLSVTCSAPSPCRAWIAYGRTRSCWTVLCCAFSSTPYSLPWHSLVYPLW